MVPEVGEGDQQRYSTCYLCPHQILKKLPTELYKSLTWDRGKELAAHQQFTLAAGFK
jgi:IS30 family transposase